MIVIQPDYPDIVGVLPDEKPSMEVMSCITMRINPSIHHNYPCENMQNMREKHYTQMFRQDQKWVYNGSTKMVGQ